MPPTVLTAKRLAIPMPNMQALVTGLAGVLRSDQQHRSTCNQGFIASELAQLVERPAMVMSALIFAPDFGALPNPGQILKRQGCTRRFCLVYQLTANGVVQPLLKASFSAREPLKESFCSFSAFALNRCSDLSEVVTNLLNLPPIPGLPGAGVSNIAPPQVHSNHLRGFTRGFGGQLNLNLNVVVPIAVLDQHRRSRRLPFQQRQLVIANGQRKPNPTGHQGDANVLILLPIGERSHVQADRSGSKLVDLLLPGQCSYYPSNCLADVIGFQSRTGLNDVVGQMVKLSRVLHLLSFGYFQYLIASISESLQSLVNFLTQLYRDLKLTRYGDSLCHDPIIVHLSLRGETAVKTARWFFLPHLKDGGFQTYRRFL